jgi:RNA polymerase sigma-70 factor (ECF subfamily)
MADPEPQDVTLFLRGMRSGDPASHHLLTDFVYPKLRRMAHAYFQNEKRERVLQPTALVNEAYLRLVGHQDHNWRNRAHFFGAASQLMHRILIEHARSRLADKRRGELVPLEEAFGVSEERSVALLTLDEGMTELARISPRQAQIVEMRFFGGLTVDEVAEALGLTPRTVDRHWAVARAWLRRYLKR